MKIGAGIGVLSLLICVGIVLYLYAGPAGPGGSSYLGTVANKKQQASQQVNQMAGRDADGRGLRETVTFERWPASGSMKGVVVKTVDPTGPAALHFSLQPGDIITLIGPQEVGGTIIGDEAAVADFLEDAFARSLKLTVTRENERITLP